MEFGLYIECVLLNEYPSYHFFNSDQARRKFDGRAEARIIEIACSPAPKGHSRWTLRLLEEQAKIVLDVPVSKDTIGRA